MLALRIVAAHCLVLFAAQTAHSQAALRGPGPSMQPPPAMELTTSDVERLLKVIPEVAKVGAKHSGRFMQSLGGGGQGQGDMPSEVEIGEMQAVLGKHKLEMMEFAVQMSTLMATYFALEPAAFERHMPNENSPEFKKMLADPQVSQEHKDQVRQQLRMAQQNKEQIRMQLNQLTSASNRDVVKPFLSRLEKVLTDAREAGLKAKESPKPSAAPQPTKKK